MDIQKYGNSHELAEPWLQKYKKSRQTIKGRKDSLSLQIGIAYGCNPLYTHSL